jgi:hypothetical protein
VNQVFVHSKIVLVDDLWATAGSANLDGVSLHSYGDDFSGALARRVFRHVRNVDVNVVVSEREQPGSGCVADLRMRLWSEHLGIPSGGLALRPVAGWLPVWRARAAANVAALSGETGEAPQMRGFVLPYSVEPSPRRQLEDVGVRVEPSRFDLRFNPSRLDIWCSPQWVRNMFG